MRTCCISLLVLVTAAAHTSAQQRYRRIEEPQLFKGQITGIYTGLFMEAVHEETNFRRAGTTATYDRFFIGPLIGLNARGSIYHPNLLQYSISGEGSVGWAEERVRSVRNFDRSEFQYLGNFQANAFILSGRPYRSDLFYSQMHTFRDYDFFSRVTVDTVRYGGSSGYQAGPVPFTVRVWRRTEDSHGFTDDSSLREIGLSFDARNDRSHGSTTFNYTFNDYTRRDFTLEAGGTDHSFGISDTELFGSRNHIRLHTSAGYSSREYTDSPSDDTSASANLAIEHRPTLFSFYDVNYYHASSGPVDSDNYTGGASVRHQLYESLTSTVRAQGLHYSSSSPGGRVETTRYGGGITEHYVKRLGKHARLSLLGSMLLEHTDQNVSGSVIAVIDEPHAFRTTGGVPSDTFFLNLPFVNLASIVVTDDSNTLPAYQEGLDYIVYRSGLLTVIERRIGSRIPRDTTVFVDYEAASSPSGSYETLTGLVQVRVDFWNNLLGVYGRLNSVENNAPPELVVQDLTAWAFGTDVNWRWLRAGAEYEIYDSNFSSYRTARLFQSLAFRPDDASTLNFDFTQSWTTYRDADREEENYAFISRYHRRLSAYLGLNLEGGVAWRIGEGVDQTRAAVRPGVEFNMGQLSVKAGYSFEYEEFLSSEERYKHMLVVRARRTF